MAIPNKPAPVKQIFLSGHLPMMPKIPDKMVKRFPELGDYNQQMDRFWDSVRDLIQQDRDNIQAALLKKP